jgi:lipopolysaccharide/colanic/teichoic acid biosynthesis glycosyltransferase
MKRAFDIVVSGLGLVLLGPLMAAIAVAIRLTSPGPVLFRQYRVGRRFEQFEILKFRTMVVNAHELGGLLTASTDDRVTRVGRVLRRTKLDELPQLINVLKGEMSFVGPRPEVPRYVEQFRHDYERLLRVRPGITDPASISFRDESAILGEAEDPERTYVEEILPAKIRLSDEYISRATLASDVRTILRTIFG